MDDALRTIRPQRSSREAERTARFERRFAQPFRAAYFQPKVARKAQRQAEHALWEVLVDRHGDRYDVVGHLVDQVKTPPDREGR